MTCRQTVNTCKDRCADRIYRYNIPIERQANIFLDLDTYSDIDTFLDIYKDMDTFLDLEAYPDIDTFLDI